MNPRIFINIGLKIDCELLMQLQNYKTISHIQ